MCFLLVGGSADLTIRTPDWSKDKTQKDCLKRRYILSGRFSGNTATGCISFLQQESVMQLVVVDGLLEKPIYLTLCAAEIEELRTLLVALRPLLITLDRFPEVHVLS
jgi:hypothetical protein